MSRLEWGPYARFVKAFWGGTEAAQPVLKDDLAVAGRNMYIPRDKDPLAGRAAFVLVMPLVCPSCQDDLGDWRMYQVPASAFAGVNEPVRCTSRVSWLFFKRADGAVTNHRARFDLARLTRIYDQCRTKRCTRCGT